MTASPPSFPSRPEAAACRAVLRQARWAVLGTLSREDRGPFVSRVAFAVDWDGAPLMLLSDLAEHTRNLTADPRVSIFVDEAGVDDDVLRASRVTVLGRIARCTDERAHARFLALHPEAARYAALADFHLYRMAPARAHFVAGFARVHWIEEGDLLLAAGAQLAADEADILAHMNKDHHEAVALYATRLLRAPDGDWRLAAIDPEGADLTDGSSWQRLPFGAPVADAAAARAELVRLAKAARASSNT